MSGVYLLAQKQQAIVQQSDDDESDEEDDESEEDEEEDELQGILQTDEDVFEVEKIVSQRAVKGKKQYMVKWKNFSSSENTWEPEENILQKNLIDEYLQRCGKAPRKKAGKGTHTTPTVAVEHRLEPTRARSTRTAAHSAAKRAAHTAAIEEGDIEELTDEDDNESNSGSPSSQSAGPRPHSNDPRSSNITETASTGARAKKQKASAPAKRPEAKRAHRAPAATPNPARPRLPDSSDDEDTLEAE